MEDKTKKNIAIVYCETISEICAGSGCFKAYNQNKQQFALHDIETEIIGFFSCGGCPGRRVSRLVDKLLKHQLDAVHLSTCMMARDEDSYKCPFWQSIKKSIEKKGVQVILGTH